MFAARDFVPPQPQPGNWRPGHDGLRARPPSAPTGRPDREVCLFAGDGGCRLIIQEPGTIFQSQVAVKIVLLNNPIWAWYGSGRNSSHDRRYSFTELANPDFGLIARGNGIAAA